MEDTMSLLKPNSLEFAGFAIPDHLETPVTFPRNVFEVFEGDQLTFG